MASLKLFGKIGSKPVYLIKLTNQQIEVELLSFGATVRSLRAKDKFGVMRDVVLGYDSIEEYLNNDGYLGATVGRCANRISNSIFFINGKKYKLTPNENANQLHGGKEGFSHKCWSFKCLENSVTFLLDSPDGDEGYPGNLHAEVSFSINNSSLRIDYFAFSDMDTVINLTNHSYFNLSGHGSGCVSSHMLKLGAEKYTPCSEGNIPTGTIESVKGTVLDFTNRKELSSALIPLETAPTTGLDHNFVITDKVAAQLYSPESGIEMSCSSSLEGIQIYSAGFLTPRCGKENSLYEKFQGICFETQHFPDAVNKPSFPSPIVKAGEKYNHWTEFKFEVK